MRHRAIQNQEVYSLLDDSGLKVDAAAVLDGGRELYCQSRLEGVNHITLKNGQKDKLLQYLTARWGHTGQTSLVVGWAGTRVVCANTLAHATLEAIASEGSARVKHTESAQLKLVDLKAAIKQAASAREALLKTYQNMANKQASPALVQATLAVAFPNKMLDGDINAAPTESNKETSTTGATKAMNLRNRVSQILQAGEYNTPTDGSVWGLFQAISAYASHESIVRGKTGAQAQTSRWLRSTIDGDKTTELAYQFLVRQ